MKKGLVFFFGMLTGCVLTIAALFYIAKVYNSEGEVPGLVLYEQPSEVISSPSFEVMQVISAGYALAHAKSDYGHNGILVLLVASESQHYYDEQVVKVPKGKCAIQIGTYQYTANSGMRKTVPAVRIMDK